MGAHSVPRRRATPRVKAASIAAVLTPALLYLADRYLPGYADLPGELTGWITAGLTALAAWAAGWLASAVNRSRLLAVLLPPAEPAEPATVEMPFLPPVPR